MTKVLLLSLMLTLFGTGQRSATAVVLTAAEPDAAFSLPAAPDRDMNTAVFVTVTKVVNPKSVALSLDFALSAEPVGMGPTYRPTPISTVGFYPADHTGSYALNLAPALRMIRQKQPQATRFLLHASLHPTTESDDISAVQVTVTLPAWSKEK